MLRVLTPARTNDLTVLETAKDELGIPADDTSKDDRLGRLIAQASSMVANACGRQGFGRALYEETFTPPPYAPSGFGGHRLSGDIDVQIVSVVSNGVPMGATDYALEGAILRRAHAYGRSAGVAWGATVTYWSGWELLGPLPHELERKCLEVVGALFASSVARDPSIREEETQGSGRVAYGTQGMTLVTKGLLDDPILNPYRRVPEF